MIEDNTLTESNFSMDLPTDEYEKVNRIPKYFGKSPSEISTLLKKYEKANSIQRAQRKHQFEKGRNYR